MLLNINTAFNLDDIVYVVTYGWDSEQETPLYHAPRKPAQIKRVDVIQESEYILSNRLGKISTRIEYYFKAFDQNFLSCNAKNEKMCFATWEEADKYANKLNKK